MTDEEKIALLRLHAYHMVNTEWHYDLLCDRAKARNAMRNRADRIIEIVKSLDEASEAKP